METVTTATGPPSHIPALMPNLNQNKKKTKLLTKIHRLVAPGADVGSSRERREAGSWKNTKLLDVVLFCMNES